MAKKRKKKQVKRTVSARFLWLLLVICALLFFISFFRMPMFPKFWSFILLLVLGLIVYLTGALSIKYYKNSVVKTLDVILSVFMFIGSIFLPSLQNRITDLFTTFTGDGARVNVYVMSDSYRKKHPDVFETADTSDKISDYVNASFLTCAAVDGGNQNYVLQQLRSEFGKEPNTTDRQSAQAAVAALYNNEADVMILSSSFESMIMEDEFYENFKKDTKIISYYVRPKQQEVVLSTDKITEEPFIVFFGGNDEEGDLYLEGKTDVDMLVAVNPNTHQIAIVSLPRDSYVMNPAAGAYDKLTHLGMSGIQNTLKGLGDYLDCKVDNYVIINFTTFKNIIDAIGGVDIYNEYEFTALNDMVFPAGDIHLEGEYALMFVRERYALPDGDFGRNYHQQQVMRAIIEKITSPALIVHFDNLLEGIKGTFLTNLSSDSLYAFCRKQLEENIQWNIVNYHVLGDNDMNEVATAPGQMLSVVYPYTNHVEFVSDVIKAVMDGEELVQEELPEGDYSDEFYQTFYGYNPNDYQPDYTTYETYDDSQYEETHGQETEYQENADDNAADESAGEGTEMPDGQQSDTEETN